MNREIECLKRLRTLDPYDWSCYYRSYQNEPYGRAIQKIMIHLTGGTMMPIEELESSINELPPMFLKGFKHPDELRFVDHRGFFKVIKEDNKYWGYLLCKEQYPESTIEEEVRLQLFTKEDREYSDRWDVGVFVEKETEDFNDDIFLFTEESLYVSAFQKAKELSKEARRLRRYNLRRKKEHQE